MHPLDPVRGEDPRYPDDSDSVRVATAGPHHQETAAHLLGDRAENAARRQTHAGDDSRLRCLS